MAIPGAFLGSAKSRLLPASVPFRFFGAATVFHVLAWVALFAAAPNTPGFAGGLGVPLAALHLFTLGVLVMTAIGASLQLLPVATRQPVAAPRGPALLWWLYTPGVAAVAAGMAAGVPWLLAGGAALVAMALVGYAAVLGRNLLGAKGMPVVVAHGWVALASLGVVLATAVSLACAYLGHPIFDRHVGLLLHVTFAAYGFMGMLVLGLSYILVPMFALADAPATRAALSSAVCAAVGLVLAGAAAWGGASRTLLALAIVCGAAGLGLHLRLMLTALRTGMRRQLGKSFVLVRFGWGGVAASLVAALGLALDAPVERPRMLFGVLLIGGLLTFLLGILSRIVPFLASMHAATGQRAVPMPSALTAQRPLDIHFGCHLAAWALLIGAVLADSTWGVRAAALAGAAGAVAFGGFFYTACRRMVAGGAVPTVASPVAGADLRCIK